MATRDWSAHGQPDRRSTRAGQPATTSTVPPPVRGRCPRPGRRRPCHHPHVDEHQREWDRRPALRRAHLERRGTDRRSSLIPLLSDGFSDRACCGAVRIAWKSGPRFAPDWKQSPRASSWHGRTSKAAAIVTRLRPRFTPPPSGRNRSEYGERQQIVGRAQTHRFEAISARTTEQPVDVLKPISVGSGFESLMAHQNPRSGRFTWPDHSACHVRREGECDPRKTCPFAAKPPCAASVR